MRVVVTAAEDRRDAAASRRRAGTARPGGRRCGAVSPVGSTKPGRRQHLAPEVALVQRLAPHRFVDAPQLAERERLVEERGRERRVLELGAGALDAVGDDARVVERERHAVVAADAVDREVVDRPEPRVGRVGAGDDARCAR